VKNLDLSQYKVMLVWDPDSARDVGWLTVERGFKVVLSELQVRDVNLNKVVISSSKEEEDGNNNDNEEDHNVTDSSNHDFKEANQEVMKDVERTSESGNIDDGSLPSKVTVGGKGKRYYPENRIHCSDCDIFVTSGYYNQHRVRVHGETFKKFEKVKCDICGFHVNEVNLEFHKQTIHGVGGIKNNKTKAKSFKCSGCSKTFPTTKGLALHKTIVHNGGRKITGGNHVKPEMNEIKIPDVESSVPGIVDKEDEVMVKTNQVQNAEGEDVNVSSPQVQNAKVMSKSSQVQNYPSSTDLLERKNLCQGNGVKRDNSITGEHSVKVERVERVSFNISYEGKSYSCSRSQGLSVKASLKKFCKLVVGKDLEFEFAGQVLSGTEIVDTFSGGTILASILQ